MDAGRGGRVRLLLDTHVLLWWLEGAALAGAAAAAIADGENAVAVSAASIWEISIKRELGKLRVPADFVEHVEATRFSALPVTADHGWRAGGLPPHHRDPFDRVLVAQAQVEGLTLVTRDPRFSQYDVSLLPA
jgi:PIN domain nuclease of toxin-antitoxin system